MCHHYVGQKKANKELLEVAFSVHTNLALVIPELLAPEDGYWPCDKVPVIKLDQNGDRELAAMEWGLLPFWWMPTDKRTKRTGMQRKCVNAVGANAIRVHFDALPALIDISTGQYCSIASAQRTCGDTPHYILVRDGWGESTPSPQPPGRGQADFRHGCQS